MSLVTLNAHDADLRIPGFGGLLQFGDGINADPRTACDAVNVDTTGGVLQPAGAHEQLVPEIAAGPMETLAFLHRRWYPGGDRDLLIAAAAGQLYCKTLAGEAWAMLELPEDWAGDSYASSSWSWVTYEINDEEAENPVDALFLSNAQDGMIYVRGDDLSVHAISTPKKFGVIARYGERIWGGSIPDDPDMLVYSAPFDPTDWTANQDIPADGAGDVMQPSWDGDSFHALRQLGSQLIAFKRNRIWRVMNTDPAEFVFKEQYGGGTQYFNTIAVDGEHIFMLGDEGIMIYDGLQAAYFQKEACRDIFAGMNKTALDQACACMWRGTYYCAFPTGTDTANSIVLMYNTKEQTWLVRNDVSVESFLPTNDDLFFTSSAAPGKIYKWGADAWTSGKAVPGAVWTGAWQDFNQKTIRKGGFELYLTVEAKADCTITFGIETEKRRKDKAVAFKATAGTARQRAVRFGGTGRRFRLIIASNTPEGTAPAAWRMIGGIQLRAEIDAD